MAFHLDAELCVVHVGDSITDVVGGNETAFRLRLTHSTFVPASACCCVLTD